MISLTPSSKKTPEFYTKLRQQVATQADSLDETFVDTKQHSTDVFVKTSIWTKGESPCSSTKANYELDRRDDYMAFSVITKNVDGDSIGIRRVQYFELADGGYRVQDFDGKSITDTLLPA